MDRQMWNLKQLFRCSHITFTSLKGNHDGVLKKGIEDGGLGSLTKPGNTGVVVQRQKKCGSCPFLSPLILPMILLLPYILPVERLPLKNFILCLYVPHARFMLVRHLLGKLFKKFAFISLILKAEFQVIRLLLCHSLTKNYRLLLSFK